MSDLIRRTAVPAAVFFVALLLYVGGSFVIGAPLPSSGDNMPSKLIPISILTRGRLDLDDFAASRGQGADPYWLIRVGGHAWSKYPIGAALCLVPFYAVASRLGFDVLNDPLVADETSRLAAAVSCAAAVLLIYLAFAPKGRGRALVCAAAVGIGSNVWPLASQEPWQHSFGVTFMAWAVLLLERSQDEVRRLRWLGLAAGLLILMRPANAPLAAILGTYVAWRSLREAVLFALLALPCVAIMVGYNAAAFGTLVGGYSGEFGLMRPWPTMLESIPGLLVSPSRGLLVYSPWTLLGAAAFLRPAGRRGALRILYVALVGGQLALYSSFPIWYAGHCWGPRFLIELLPIFAALLWEAMPALTSIAGRLATATVLGWSIVLAATGVVVPWSVWNANPDVDYCQGRLWDWRDSPWVSVWLGLPDHCPHPYSAGPDEFRTYGAGIAFGVGWTMEGDQRLALPEAVILVRAHGRPVNQLQISLSPEPGLDGPQEVEAIVGDRTTAVRLSAGSSTLIAVPLIGAESADEIAVTLRFKQARYRSRYDIRRVAARLDGMRYGFSRTPDVPAIPVSR